MNAEERKEYVEIMRQILIAYPNYERFSDERKCQIWQEYMFCLALNLISSVKKDQLSFAVDMNFRKNEVFQNQTIINKL